MSTLAENFTALPADQSSQRGIAYFAFYTTFFTSIWVWFFFFSTSLANLGERLGGPAWLFLRDRMLDFGQKPFLSLGYLTCIAVVLAATTFWLLTLVARMLSAA